MQEMDSKLVELKLIQKFIDEIYNDFAYHQRILKVLRTLQLFLKCIPIFCLFVLIYGGIISKNIEVSILCFCILIICRFNFVTVMSDRTNENDFQLFDDKYKYIRNLLSEWPHEKILISSFSEVVDLLSEWKNNSKYWLTFYDLISLFLLDGSVLIWNAICLIITPIDMISRTYVLLYYLHILKFYRLEIFLVITLITLGAEKFIRNRKRLQVEKNKLKERLDELYFIIDKEIRGIVDRNEGKGETKDEVGNTKEELPSDGKQQSEGKRKQLETKGKATISKKKNRKRHDKIDDDDDDDDLGNHISARQGNTGANPKIQDDGIKSNVIPNRQKNIQKTTNKVKCARKVYNKRTKRESKDYKSFNENSEKESFDIKDKTVNENKDLQKNGQSVSVTANETAKVKSIHEKENLDEKENNYFTKAESEENDSKPGNPYHIQIETETNLKAGDKYDDASQELKRNFLQASEVEAAAAKVKTQKCLNENGEVESTNSTDKAECSGNNLEKSDTTNKQLEQRCTTRTLEKAVDENKDLKNKDQMTRGTGDELENVKVFQEKENLDQNDKNSCIKTDTEENELKAGDPSYIQPAKETNLDEKGEYSDVSHEIKQNFLEHREPAFEPMKVNSENCMNEKENADVGNMKSNDRTDFSGKSLENNCTSNEHLEERCFPPIIGKTFDESKELQRNDQTVSGTGTERAKVKALHEKENLDQNDKNSWNEMEFEENDLKAGGPSRIHTGKEIILDEADKDGDVSGKVKQSFLPDNELLSAAEKVNTEKYLNENQNGQAENNNSNDTTDSSGDNLENNDISKEYEEGRCSFLAAEKTVHENKHLQNNVKNVSGTRDETEEVETFHEKANFVENDKNDCIEMKLEEKKDGDPTPIPSKKETNLHEEGKDGDMAHELKQYILLRNELVEAEEKVNADKSLNEDKDGEVENTKSNNTTESSGSNPENNDTTNEHLEEGCSPRDLENTFDLNKHLQSSEKIVSGIGEDMAKVKVLHETEYLDQSDKSYRPSKNSCIKTEFEENDLKAGDPSYIQPGKEIDFNEADKHDDASEKLKQNFPPDSENFFSGIGEDTAKVKALHKTEYLDQSDKSSLPNKNSCIKTEFKENDLKTGDPSYIHPGKEINFDEADKHDDESEELKRNFPPDSEGAAVVEIMNAEKSSKEYWNGEVKTTNSNDRTDSSGNNLEYNNTSTEYPEKRCSPFAAEKTDHENEDLQSNFMDIYEERDEALKEKALEKKENVDQKDKNSYVQTEMEEDHLKSPDPSRIQPGKEITLDEGDKDGDENKKFKQNFRLNSEETAAVEKMNVGKRMNENENEEMKNSNENHRSDSSGNNSENNDNSNKYLEESSPSAVEKPVHDKRHLQSNVLNVSGTEDETEKVEALKEKENLDRIDKNASVKTKLEENDLAADVSLSARIHTGKETNLDKETKEVDMSHEHEHKQNILSDRESEEATEKLKAEKSLNKDEDEEVENNNTNDKSDSSRNNSENRDTPNEYLKEKRSSPVLEKTDHKNKDLQSNVQNVGGTGHKTTKVKALEEKENLEQNDKNDYVKLGHNELKAVDTARIHTGRETNLNKEVDMSHEYIQNISSDSESEGATEKLKTENDEEAKNKKTNDKTDSSGNNSESSDIPNEYLEENSPPISEKTDHQNIQSNILDVVRTGDETAKVKALQEKRNLEQNGKNAYVKTEFEGNDLKADDLFLIHSGKGINLEKGDKDHRAFKELKQNLPSDSEVTAAMENANAKERLNKKDNWQWDNTNSKEISNFSGNNLENNNTSNEHFKEECSPSAKEIFFDENKELQTSCQIVSGTRRETAEVKPLNERENLDQKDKLSYVKMDFEKKDLKASDPSHIKLGNETNAVEEGKDDGTSCESKQNLLLNGEIATISEEVNTETLLNEIEIGETEKRNSKDTIDAPENNLEKNDNSKEYETERCYRSDSKKAVDEKTDLQRKALNTSATGDEIVEVKVFHEKEILGQNVKIFCVGTKLEKNVLKASDPSLINPGKITNLDGECKDDDASYEFIPNILTTAAAKVNAEKGLNEYRNEVVENTNSKDSTDFSGNYSENKPTSEEYQEEKCSLPESEQSVDEKKDLQNNVLNVSVTGNETAEVAVSREKESLGQKDKGSGAKTEFEKNDLKSGDSNCIHPRKEINLNEGDKEDDANREFKEIFQPISEVATAATKVNEESLKEDESDEVGNTNSNNKKDSSGNNLEKSDTSNEHLKDGVSLRAIEKTVDGGKILQSRAKTISGIIDKIDSLDANIEIPERLVMILQEFIWKLKAIYEKENLGQNDKNSCIKTELEENDLKTVEVSRTRQRKANSLDEEGKNEDALQEFSQIYLPDNAAVATRVNAEKCLNQKENVEAEDSTNNTSGNNLESNDTSNEHLEEECFLRAIEKTSDEKKDLEISSQYISGRRGETMEMKSLSEKENLDQKDKSSYSETEFAGNDSKSGDLSRTYSRKEINLDEAEKAADVSKELKQKVLLDSEVAAATAKMNTEKRLNENGNGEVENTNSDYRTDFPGNNLENKDTSKKYPEERRFPHAAENTFDENKDLQISCQNLSGIGNETSEVTFDENKDLQSSCQNLSGIGNETSEVTFDENKDLHSSCQNLSEIGNETSEVTFDKNKDLQSSCQNLSGIGNETSEVIFDENKDLQSSCKNLSGIGNEITEVTFDENKNSHKMLESDNSSEKASKFDGIREETVCSCVKKVQASYIVHANVSCNATCDIKNEYENAANSKNERDISEGKIPSKMIDSLPDCSNVNDQTLQKDTPTEELALHNSDSNEDISAQNLPKAEVKEWNEECSHNESSLSMMERSHHFKCKCPKKHKKQNRMALKTPCFQKDNVVANDGKSKVMISQKFFQFESGLERDSNVVLTYRSSTKQRKTEVLEHSLNFEFKKLP